MKYCWCIEPAQPVLAGRLAQAHRVSPVIAQCLINRGIADDESIPGFLDPKLRNLSDPFLLPGMEAAVERLLKAHQTGEPLLIFGDYDVDGVTSAALLLELFESLGWKADCYLPHRRDEGYGLTMEAVTNCLERHPMKLLLAVDCGSTSVESIAMLRNRGVDVIVLDHHQPSDPLPNASAIINPLAVGNGSSQSTGKPPFSELCSAGLAFKLAHALVKRGRKSGIGAAESFDLRPLLDLVALGTVADVVPLVRENRVLVSAGLERMSRTQRPGLIALKQVAQCPATIGVHETGFQLAPRLNAAGRLETAAGALALLRARSLEEALPMARELDERNRERQGIEKGIVASALSRIEARFRAEADFVIVEGDPAWHIGVVGIVASRVLQRFYRPTIIFGGDGGHWRGSGRSVSGFNLAGALKDCGDLLVRHGGHAMAAGVTIDPARIDAFRERLNDVAQRALSRQTLRPRLQIDAEIGLDEVTFALLDGLQRLRPFGTGNPAPQFAARGLSHHRPLMKMGSEKQHVKMWVTDGVMFHEAVWWGAGDGQLPVGTFDLAFEPAMNHYNGRSTIQLKVLDWQPSEKPGGTGVMRF